MFLPAPLPIGRFAPRFGGVVPVLPFCCSNSREGTMRNIFWLIGVIVVIIIILSLVGIV